MVRKAYIKPEPDYPFEVTVEYKFTSGSEDSERGSNLQSLSPEVWSMEVPKERQALHVSVFQTKNQLAQLADTVQRIIGGGRDQALDYALLEAHSYLKQALSSLEKAEQLSKQK